jgi:hypothetical protein
VSSTVVNGKLTRIDRRQRQFAVGRQALYFCLGWDIFFGMYVLFIKFFFQCILH